MCAMKPSGVKPTIQRKSGQGFVDAAQEMATAWLTGQYTFNFSNETRRTVKLHLTDDRHDRGNQDYFLTLPVHSKRVEVPMRFDMITVTAGFFDDTSKTYEIFWESRRFAWDCGIEICVCERHSVDANRICTDVWPGAPELRGPGAQRGRMLLDGPFGEQLASAAYEPSTGGFSVVGSGVSSSNGGSHARGSRVSSSNGSSAHSSSGSSGSMRLYSRRASQDGGWAGCDISRALPDGTLEVSDQQGQVFHVRPHEEPALLALPLGSTASSWASRLSLESDMAPPPSNLRHPREKLREGADSFPSSLGYTLSTSPSPASNRR